MSDADWDGIEQFREEARALAEAPFLRAEQLAAELARIRRAVIDTYGEDYGGKDVAAEVERLFRHLAEFESNMGRILGAKSEAIERENLAAGIAIAKYSIAKERAEAAEAAVQRVERLRDKWLTWPKDDMHYAAGLMLARHLSGEAFSVNARPVSVESPGNDGFRFEAPGGES